MADTNREIQELLVDYAGALRDGCVPSFLKSLEREEAQRIASSRQFQDAADVRRQGCAPECGSVHIPCRCQDFIANEKIQSVVTG
jgi:hypothetical protein